MRKSRKYNKHSLAKGNSKKNNRRFPKRNTNKNFKKNNRVNSKKNNRRLLKRNTNKKLKFKNKTKKNKFNMIGGAKNLYENIKKEIDASIKTGNTQIPLFLGNISLNAIDKAGLPNTHKRDLENGENGLDLNITELFFLTSGSNKRAKEIFSILKTFSDRAKCDSKEEEKNTFEGNPISDKYGENFINDLKKDLDSAFKKKYGLTAMSTNSSGSERMQRMGNCILKLIQDYNKMIYKSINYISLKNKLFSGFRDNDDVLTKIIKKLKEEGKDLKGYKIVCITTPKDFCFNSLELKIMEFDGEKLNVIKTYKLILSLDESKNIIYKVDGTIVSISDFNFEQLKKIDELGSANICLVKYSPSNNKGEEVTIINPDLLKHLQSIGLGDGVTNIKISEEEIQNKKYKEISHSITEINDKKFLIPNYCLNIDEDNIEIEYDGKSQSQDPFNSTPGTFDNRLETQPVLDEDKDPGAFSQTEVSYSGGTVAPLETSVTEESESPVEQPKITRSGSAVIQSGYRVPLEQNTGIPILDEVAQQQQQQYHLAKATTVHGEKVGTSGASVSKGSEEQGEVVYSPTTEGQGENVQEGQTSRPLEVVEGQALGQALVQAKPVAREETVEGRPSGPPKRKKKITRAKKIESETPQILHKIIDQRGAVEALQGKPNNFLIRYSKRTGNYVINKNVGNNQIKSLTIFENKTSQSGEYIYTCTVNSSVISKSNLPDLVKELQNNYLKDYTMITLQ